MFVHITHTPWPPVIAKMWTPLDSKILAAVTHSGVFPLLDKNNTASFSATTFPAWMERAHRHACLTSTLYLSHVCECIGRSRTIWNGNLECWFCLYETSLIASHMYCGNIHRQAGFTSYITYILGELIFSIRTCSIYFLGLDLHFGCSPRKWL